MPIVIKRSDGGVSVMHLIDGADAETEVKKWSELHAGEYVSHREMPMEAIPTERTFRGAWADVTLDAVIDHDMERARSIAKDKLREQRAPLLADLDVKFQRALEDGAETSSIVKQKKKLRDITDHRDIRTAKTPAELKASLDVVMAGMG